MQKNLNLNQTDLYAVLGLERHYYLDLNLIEEAFRRAAALSHPDQPTGSRALFQELQEATTTLRDPVKRLRYLAGIPEPSSLSLPPVAMKLFPNIIACLQTTDALLKKHQAASGTLAKALLTEELLQERRNLQQALQQVKTWESSLQHQLQTWDIMKISPSSEELLKLANQFTFAQRWLKQLQERELLLKTI